MPVKDAPGRNATDPTRGRRLPVGAEVLPDGGVSFRVWAPRRGQVEVIFQDNPRNTVPLTHESNGYFSGVASRIESDALYKLRLDGGEFLYPDPASRFQPA